MTDSLKLILLLTRWVEWDVVDDVSRGVASLGEVYICSEHASLIHSQS